MADNTDKVATVAGSAQSTSGAAPEALNTTSSSAAPGADQVAAAAAKKGKQSQAPASAPSGPAAGGEETQLSSKDAKLKKQAEKQARRAAEKAAKDAAAGVRPGVATTGTDVQGKGASDGAQARPPPGNQGRPLAAAVAQSKGQVQNLQAQQRGQQTSSRRGSQSQAQRPLAIRRRNSQTKDTPAPKEAKKPNKDVGLFGHLYGQPRRQTIEGVSKEIHPAVLSLGFQLSNYIITGSSARCVAMLLAFKQAISSYTTPPNNSLARHLTSHHLSPQIDYLKSHRPISVSMGNAIRWLKDYIIQIDPDTPENVAKADIVEAIDTFIRERITVADTAIVPVAAAKIRPGSRVVTFAKSSIVEQTLLHARAAGVDFSVTCLDSRPLFEGKNVARALSAAGVRCSYALLPAAAHVLADADLVLLGAHAMMANGRLYGRAGTAGVAMLAKSRDVPVIVCCESVKFTDRVALDSIVLNEVAPSEELVPGPGLAGWKAVQGLQLLNILYDVTPAEYIDMVITEHGSLPPSSVPVVHRLSTDREVRV